MSITITTRYQGKFNSFGTGVFRRPDYASVNSVDLTPLPFTGKPLNKDTIERAVNAALKNAEPLNKNGYKIPLFQGMLEEELRAIAKS